jgi:hypothetical protein
LHPPEVGPAPAGKKGVDTLLTQIVRQGQQRGLIRPKSRAAIDATGFENRHCNRYFVWRQGRRHRRLAWPKLTAVLEIASHLFLSAHVSKGPSQDSPQFKPAARSAAGRCAMDTLLGDSGYDAEPNHAYGRQRLQIRSTVFPLNRRNNGRRWPRTKNRRQMKKQFRRRPRRSRYRRGYGQRWQIESGRSRQKRLLGSALRARKWVTRRKRSSYEY